jgi:hypothetical protein
MAGSVSTRGQIYNSMSSDRTGMYYFAVDTLIKSLVGARQIKRIIIRADRSIAQIFPDTVQGIRIIRHPTDTKHKRRDIIVGDVVIAVYGVSIIRDQFTIAILAVERTKDGLPYIGDGSYKYYFVYDPNSRTYSLSKIKSGVIL